MIVPLGIKAYTRTAARETELENMYLEKDETGFSPDGIVRVKRPGMTLLATYPTGVIRGLNLRISDNKRTLVAGDTFYYDGVAATGTVPGTDRIKFVETAFGYWVLGGAQISSYSAGALTPLIMPDDAPPVQDIEQLENYLLILTRTGRFYWLEPGQTTVDPLNFATAESSVDSGIALCRVGDEFAIFGTTTTEFWQTTGDQDAPFQRAVGRNFERGCLYRSSVCKFDNGVIWVADNGTVCRLGNVPQVVSDNSISERIQRTPSAPFSFTFSAFGHEFYVLALFTQGTMVYDASTQTWSRFRTYGRTAWKAQAGYTQGGETLFGSNISGEVFQLDLDATNDAGTPIAIRTTGIVAFTGPAQRNDSFTLGAEVTSDAEFDIRWRDGQDDYGPVEPVTIRAPFDAASIYRLGQPDQPYRQVEVYSEADTAIRILGAKANEGWR